AHPGLPHGAELVNWVELCLSITYIRTRPTPPGPPVRDVICIPSLTEFVPTSLSSRATPLPTVSPAPMVALDSRPPSLGWRTANGRVPRKFPDPPLIPEPEKRNLA